MLSFALFLSSVALGSEACADRAALAEPAAAGTLTDEQQRCLQTLVDRGQPPEVLEAATLLWRHLRAAGVDDERRFEALRAALDRTAPHGSVIFFAKGHVGQPILVDGTEIGRAPARVAKLAAGPHLVEVRAGDQVFAHDVVIELTGEPTVVTLAD